MGETRGGPLRAVLRPGSDFPEGEIGIFQVGHGPWEWKEGEVWFTVLIVRNSGRDRRLQITIGNVGGVPKSTENDSGQDPDPKGLRA